MAKNKPLKTSYSGSLPIQSGVLKQGNLSVIFPVLLFLAVDFIPKGSAIDVMAPQWLYLSILNLCFTLFFIVRLNRYQEDFNAVITRSNIFKLQVLLLFLAGLSIFFAINPIEAIVSYPRIILSVASFIYLSIILRNRIKAIKIAATIVSVIAFGQSIYILNTFFDGVGQQPLDTLILALKGNTGNKNIMAASLVIKSSFILYSIYVSGFLGRIFHFASLTVTTLCIFLINSRASFLGLFLGIILFAIFCLLENRREKNIRQLLNNSMAGIIPIIIAFFLSQALLANAATLSTNSNSNFGSVASRLESITSTSNESNQLRLSFWKSAINYTIHHPFIGCGYGNWKIASIPYEREIINDFLTAKHAHNDFLEITTETGLPGGITYALLFVLAVIHVIKIYRSNAKQEIKIIAFFSLIGLSGYLVDASFNFPSERADMQTYLALILAINISCFDTISDATEPKRNTLIAKIYFIAATILISGATFLSYKTYQATVLDNLISADFGSEHPTLKATALENLIPSIPNISQNGIPYNIIKAWYYTQDQNHKRALQLLDSDKNTNPNLMLKEYVKALTFTGLKNLDSAYYYANKSLNGRPRSFATYFMLIQIATLKKDTAAIKDAFTLYTHYRNEPVAWQMYIKYLVELNYNSAALQTILDKGIKLFPNDILLLKEKYNRLGDEAYDRKDYAASVKYFLKVTELDQTDIQSRENAGIIYTMMAEYEKAIPYLIYIINLKKYKDGKAEYLLGISYVNTNKKNEGCTLLRTAKFLNYPDASRIVTSVCN